MTNLRPFKGYRPPKELAKKIASRPYDVLNSFEANIEAANNEYSLLHIIKPEIDLPSSTYHYDQIVYDKAKENFDLFIKKGYLIKDEKPHLYIYAQTMNEKTQYGIVGCTSIDDYMNGVIKKHELTRKDKEEDRMNHVRITNANMEPVFFTYPANEEIDNIVQDIITSYKPIYDFTANDGFGHHFWVIEDENIINKIIELFKNIPHLYVADGHHRTAAAALVGNEKKNNNPNHNGEEEYNFFMSVIFPENQLTVLDYNRLVKDLNGLNIYDFIEKLKRYFTIEKKGSNIYKPNSLHNFSMYIGTKWYSLNALPHTYDDNDPLKTLDVNVLSEYVFDRILDIKDLRTSKRIDFVGGIRGLAELSRRVDNGEMIAAFALYPVTMMQIINIADTGNIMPPKTTWFEPKLRSGLIVHTLD